ASPDAASPSAPDIPDGRRVARATATPRLARMNIAAWRLRRLRLDHHGRAPAVAIASEIVARQRFFRSAGGSGAERPFKVFSIRSTRIGPPRLPANARLQFSAAPARREAAT